MSKKDMIDQEQEAQALIAGAEAAETEAKAQSREAQAPIAEAMPREEGSMAESREAGAAEAEAGEEEEDKEKPQYPGSQEQLYSYAILGWKNFLKFLAAFNKFSKSFTEQLALDQLAFIETTKALPDKEARLSAREEAPKNTPASFMFLVGGGAAAAGYYARIMAS